MFTVEQVGAAVLQHCAVREIIGLPLLQARGHVLAEVVHADLDIPPFDNSAVDGYAVLAADTQNASEVNPVPLRTLHEIPAGEMPTQPLVACTAMRIMTGAVVPEGADAIVMIEQTRVEVPGTVSLFETAVKGDYIRRTGEDMRMGEVILQPGREIGCAEIGVLATLGRVEVAVYRPARVAILTTGDEVVDMVQDELPPPGKIRNSNRYALQALVEEVGAEVVWVGHVPDSLEGTCKALQDCSRSGVDAIVCAGGVSVGDRDFVKPALERLGTLELWRVAMKPGKPLAFGKIDASLFFGLPGNPVSAMVTFELFVRPALLQMAGRKSERREVLAQLLERIEHTPGRREYVRAVTTLEQSEFKTRTTGQQGSGRLRSMLEMDSLIVVPEERGDLYPGEHVTVRLLEKWLSPR